MHRHLTQWWNGVSLRTKITGVTVLLLTLGLLVAGVGTMSLLSRYLLDEVDQRINTAVADISDQASQLFSSEEDRSCSLGLTEEYYIAILDTDGDLLCDNRSTGAPDLSGFDEREVADLHNQPVTVWSADHERQWRVIAAPARISPGNQEITVAVGLNLDYSTNQVVARFAAIFMFFAIAVIVLGGAIARLLVMTTFAPLRDVEETAARFADGDFSQRMSGALPNTEVGRLNSSLNARLARIDRAFADRAKTIEQMRRFIGDASHELRTPLVSVRGYAELYRMGALATPQDVAQAMDRIEKEAIRMSELVRDLLELARLDESRPLEPRPVDLVPIAQDAALDASASSTDRTVTVVALEFDGSSGTAEVPTAADAAADAERGMRPARPRRGASIRPVAPRAPGRAATFATGPIAFAGAQLARLRRARPIAEPAPEPTALLEPELPAIVLGDENKIRQVVTNLLGNALRYSPEGSPIEIGVGVDASRGVGVIAVIDHGPGIPPQLRDKIFQRFWRADTSRTRETGGSGLGLAIVAAIVQSHHGTIEVDETPGGGATFRVLLPLARPDEDIPIEQLEPEHESAGS